MWETKKFKTRNAMLAWIAKNSHRYQWVELYVNNGYAIECKKLVLPGLNR